MQCARQTSVEICLSVILCMTNRNILVMPVPRAQPLAGCTPSEGPESLKPPATSHEQFRENMSVSAYNSSVPKATTRSYG